MTEGRLDEARNTLEEARNRQRQGGECARIVCRTTAALGEVHRRLGNYGTARQLLEQARTEQASHHFQGDLADFSPAYLAKLETDATRARSILAEAKVIQTDLQNRVGEAKILLLEARLADNARRTRSIKRRGLELKEDVPALAQCGLLAGILERWDHRTDGEHAPDATGDVFWSVQRTI